MRTCWPSTLRWDRPFRSCAQVPAIASLSSRPAGFSIATTKPPGDCIFWVSCAAKSSFKNVCSNEETEEFVRPLERPRRHLQPHPAGNGQPTPRAQTQPHPVHRRSHRRHRQPRLPPPTRTHQCQQQGLFGQTRQQAQGELRERPGRPESPRSGRWDGEPSRRNWPPRTAWVWNESC